MSERGSGARSLCSLESGRINSVQETYYCSQFIGVTGFYLMPKGLSISPGKDVKNGGCLAQVEIRIPSFPLNKPFYKVVTKLWTGRNRFVRGAVIGLWMREVASILLDVWWTGVI